MKHAPFDWKNVTPKDGAALPPDLKGATVLRFGIAPDHCHVEGGGLIIDYVPKRRSAPRRVVLAFNELGMWIQSLVRLAD